MSRRRACEGLEGMLRRTGERRVRACNYHLHDQSDYAHKHNKLVSLIIEAES